MPYFYAPPGNSFVGRDGSIVMGLDRVLNLPATGTNVADALNAGLLPIPTPYSIPNALPQVNGLAIASAPFLKAATL